MTVDPTIVLTSSASEAPVMIMATVKSIIGPTYRVPTSPGTSFGFKSEAAAAVDDTPTLGQTEVDVQTAYDRLLTFIRWFTCLATDTAIPSRQPGTRPSV